jgi:hypothetical protein
VIEIRSHSLIRFVRGTCRAAAVTSALIAVLAFAAPASAGSQDCTGPTGDQYCPETELLTGTGTGSADPEDPADPGGLPFTGLDLGLSLLAGAGLLGAGLALRRASRPQDVA